MAKKLEPMTIRAPRADAAQPEARIIENLPAPTAAQALANGKKQVDATK